MSCSDTSEHISTIFSNVDERINHDSSKFYNSKLYKDLEVKKYLKKEDNDFPTCLENKIILGTAEDMKELSDNSIHLMITSPPYNVSK